jgi:hypothetical protein
VNPGSSPVNVFVSYLGDDNPSSACSGVSVQGPVRTVPAGSGILVSHVRPADEGLTEDCFGAATVEATGPVVATVLDYENLGLTLALYNAIPNHDGALKVFVPVYRDGDDSFSTGLRIMNVGSEPTQVSWGTPDRRVGSGITLQPRGGQMLYWPLIAARPGVEGSVVVESSGLWSTAQPIVVVGYASSVSGRHDNGAYAAIPAVEHGCRPHCWTWLPWLMQSAELLSVRGESSVVRLPFVGR